MSVIAKNPIMAGFYPDPSVCVVGEDFYLINSTFAYFPGLPIMHSKDLANWEQIGNAMDRNEQLPLKEAKVSEGLFAPTIRYHDGVFYVICTNVSYGGNFIITASNPKGPWSNPHYLKGAEGIDPSLFFDDDGKCYYVGTHSNPKGCRYNGDNYIWIQEIDLDRMELVGEVHDVWNGAVRNIVWPEGPHIYKKDGYYYIMNAEGGTGLHHSVTVCRSREIFGPYENNFCNPILTHRHLGHAYPIQCVGHADMFETINGEWYMVMLAVRPTNGYTTLGRETFLAKVEWEDGWPVVNPGVGALTDKVIINLPNQGTENTMPANKDYDFGTIKLLGSEFVTLRNPDDDMYVLEHEKGLGLIMGRPSYVAVRQQHHHFKATCALLSQGLSDTKRAGLALVQSDDYHLRVEIGKASDDKLRAYVIMCSNGNDEIIDTHEVIDSDTINVSLCVDGLKAAVKVWTKDSTVSVTDGIDIRNLSTEVAGGFVGCTVGMYALSTQKSVEDVGGGRAYFKRFIYSNEEGLS